MTANVTKRSWLALLGVLTLASCTNSNDDSTAPTHTEDDEVAEDPHTLSVLDSDGNELSIPESDVFVWCGDFSEGSIEVPTPSVHIYSWPNLDPNYTDLPGGWIIRAVLDDIEPATPLKLPTSGFDLGLDDSRPEGADIFASVDFDDFSSQSPASEGFIVFGAKPCTEGNDTVEFEIDALLGSEDLGSETVRLQGTFVGTLNEPPQRDLYQFD